MSTHTISDGCVVSIAYTLESSSGVVYDNRLHDPIHYLHGQGLLVPGLEKALTGRIAGDEFSVELSPHEGFGPKQEAATKVYPLDIFADNLPLKVGAPMFADITKEDTFSGWITSIDNENFTVDENHPLASQHVVFKVRILEVKPTTPAELADGFAHRK